MHGNSAPGIHPPEPQEVNIQAKSVRDDQAEHLRNELERNYHTFSRGSRDPGSPPMLATSSARHSSDR
jgi:hypothetical protein